MKSSPAGTTHDYDAIWRDVYGDMQDVGPTHRHLRRLLGELLREVDYSSAVDVGCGAGHNFPILTEGRPQLRLGGVDISAEALARAAEAWPDAQFHELDIQTTSAPGTWDLVLSSLVMEHVPDDVGALERMREMTGKYLVIVTIAGNFERYRPWEEQMGHVRNYDRGELEAKLNDAGFEVQRAVYWGFPFYTPIARTLQNRMTSKADYDTQTSIAARLMYWVYWLNSRRRGDLLLVRARPTGR